MYPWELSFLCQEFNNCTVQGFCLEKKMPLNIEYQPRSLTSTLNRLNLVPLRLCHVIYYDDDKKYPYLGELGSINTSCLQMLLKNKESGTMQIVFTMLFAYRTVNKYPNPLIFYRKHILSTIRQTTNTYYIILNSKYIPISRTIYCLPFLGLLNQFLIP